MPGKKPGFTIEKHKQVASELFQMRERLADLSNELTAAYPVKISGLAKVARDAVDALRCQLDNLVAREQLMDEGATRIYYPVK